MLAILSGARKAASPCCRFPSATMGFDSWRLLQPFAPLLGVNRSSTHNADKISLRVNFVAFRVPANLDDPRRAVCFLPPSRPRCGERSV